LLKKLRFRNNIKNTKGVREMKERPIIMSAESVKAILDGRKTQTRRIVKVANDEPCGVGVHFDGKTKGLKAFYINTNGDINDYRCPYGQAGERLWVKENLEKEQYGAISYAANHEFIPETSWVWKNDKLSAMFMPKGLSRITLEITNIRVERLQDITEKDAKAEGCDVTDNDLIACYNYENARNKYEKLWNKLNAKRGYSWDTNPFVWVIEFRRVE